MAQSSTADDGRAVESHETNRCWPSMWTSRRTKTQGIHIAAHACWSSVIGKTTAAATQYHHPRGARHLIERRRWCWTSKHASCDAREASLHAHKAGVIGMWHDAQTDMLPGEPRSAICVQRFDDSLSSAIYTTYRSWLRFSSMHEPRDPPLEVVACAFYHKPPCPSAWGGHGASRNERHYVHTHISDEKMENRSLLPTHRQRLQHKADGKSPPFKHRRTQAGKQASKQGSQLSSKHATYSVHLKRMVRVHSGRVVPASSSCCETNALSVVSTHRNEPSAGLLDHSIGSSDGRCVQRAGT